MKAALIVCRDPFHPGMHREVRTISRRRRVRALAPRIRQPMICIYNGRPLLRAAWRMRVRDGDVILFVALPEGGGGDKNPLAVVLQLAVMVFAPQLALAALGTVPGAFIATWLGGTHIFLAVARGVITLAGMALVNALLPPPRPPAAQQIAQLAEPSPTYSLQAQGNAARLGGVIPVIYGRHLIYPDHAAQPYTEYAGNEQYLYQLLVIGQGQYYIEAIRIEDTVIQTDPVADGSIQTAGGPWQDIQYQIVYDAPPTLFPSLVVTAPEVSGIEAMTGTALGPFVVNPAGSQIIAIGVDVIAPRGLFGVSGSAITQKSITFTVEARTIDDAGAPTGSWTTLGTETITGATTTPQRASYRYAVSAARYEVRLTRTDTKDTSGTVGHDLLWGSLRGYLPGTQSYGKITLLALRMRASNQLSGASARRINCIVTRKLPIWNGTSWIAPQTTRSIAWALADMLRAEYGAKLSDSRIDLSSLLALDAVWAARHDYYDAVHDSAQTIWEALSQCARAGRALVYIQSGVVRFVRDAPQSTPVALYSPRNIVRGSLSIQYLMPSDETADSVDVEYFDADTWSWRTVRAALAGSAQERIATLRLPGITSRAQAWREGMYIAAANRYRRRIVSWQTEMEGFIPSVGDLVALTHDVPSWGQSGEVVAWDAASRTLTLSEPLDWSGSGHYIALRKRDGSVSGPWPCSRGARDDLAVLLATPDITPDTGPDRERTHFAFGPSSSVYILVRVIATRPRASELVEIGAVVESDFVHTAETGSPPGASAWQLPADFSVPQVDGLVSRSDPNDVSLALLSWRPAAGAERYLIEAANGTDPNDPALKWTRVAETTANNIAVRAVYGANTLFRVAAIGATRGPWVTVMYGASADYMYQPAGDPMWTPGTSTMW